MIFNKWQVINILLQRIKCQFHFVSTGKSSQNLKNKHTNKEKVFRMQYLPKPIQMSPVHIPTQNRKDMYSSPIDLKEIKDFNSKLSYFLKQFPTYLRANFKHYLFKH